MKKIKNKIPKFKNEDEERAFWANHSILDFMDQLAPVNKGWQLPQFDFIV